ncbi:MAG: hypothetical protein U5M53_05755 [Rhodoferax sp.]|nr:hypothetical protein [Rhodoferax sp.]
MQQLVAISGAVSALQLVLMNMGTNQPVAIRQAHIDGAGSLNGALFVHLADASHQC